MPESLKPVMTQDGSVSCFDPETSELYHNKAGAYTEAVRHYLEPAQALQHLRTHGRLRVLDVCFGLGYNTWVLLEAVLRDPPKSFSITIVAVERDPEILTMSREILNDPRLYNLKKFLGTPEHNIYYQTHWWGEKIIMSVADRGTLSLDFRCEDLRKALPKMVGSPIREKSGPPDDLYKECFDLIFHDGFSPRKVPELWTVDLFRIYHQLLAPGHGLLLTYSAANAVRGGLLEAGFSLGRTGPLGGKTYGGTIAGVSDAFLSAENDWIQPLTEENHLKLATRAGIPYRDVDFATPRETIFANRRLEQGIV